LKERQAAVKSVRLKSPGVANEVSKGTMGCMSTARSTASMRARVADAGRRTKNARRAAVAGIASMCSAMSMSTRGSSCCGSFTACSGMLGVSRRNPTVSGRKKRMLMARPLQRAKQLPTLRRWRIGGQRLAVMGLGFTRAISTFAAISAGSSPA
jgi:hypothetical protein